MRAGFPSHVDLTVADLGRSVAFYDRVLAPMGYRRPARPPASAPPTWFVFDSHGRFFSMSLFPARADRADRRHDRHAPGLNHLAFRVATRQAVEEMHQLLCGLGARILRAPAEYAYTPGYYAVFFTDPDGLKLEVVSEPAQDRARRACPSCGELTPEAAAGCPGCGLSFEQSGG